jgi:DNA ligase-1
MEREGSRYRTIAGLDGGSEVISGWTQAKAASCPTDEAQAIFEVEAKYRHQLAREYRETIDEARNVGATFLEPMLAKSYSGFPGPGFMQPKLDGIRCIARAEGLFSRQGQPITAVPHIHASLAPLFEANPDLILDGELYNHDLREDFGAISSIVRKAKPTAEALEKAEKVMQYHIYDLPEQVSFLERHIRIKSMLDTLDCSWIVPVQTHGVNSEAEADQLYGQFVEQGYEGGMFRLNKPYEIGRRSKSLLKRKEFITDEFPVISIEPGNGNWAGLAKRVTLRLPDGRTFGAGIRGSAERARELLSETYAEATVRFFCLSPDGVPRFPVVIDFHKNGRKD